MLRIAKILFQIMKGSSNKFSYERSAYIYIYMSR